MIQKKRKNKIKNLYSPLVLQKTRQKQENQNNLHRFSINLNTSQGFVCKKSSSTLLENWIQLPKNKQIFYYKLYWKLLRSQIKFQKIQEEKIKEKSNWIHESRVNPFWIKVKYKKFTSKRHLGYTIYEEKVLDFGKTKYMTILSDYKKFKTYYKF